MEEARISDETPVAHDSLIHRAVKLLHYAHESINNIVDFVANLSGSIPFLALNAVTFTGWIVANTILPKQFHFDPYPFQFLTLAVSLEAIFLSIFVLISQNRQSAKNKADDEAQKERDRQHEQAERDRQNAQMQEEIELNRKEEIENVNILALLDKVNATLAKQDATMATQQTEMAQHREILERVATLMEPKTTKRRG